MAGASELIEDAKSDILIKDPTNIKEIADKIELLLKDEGLREFLGRNGRKVAENYSWDVIAEENLAVYKKVLNNHSSVC